MATTAKPLFRGAATVTLTTVLYTVPALTNTVVTNIVITNTAGASATVTISLNGIVLIPALTVAANSVTPFDLKQTIPTTQTITGGASATTVNFHISGVEIA